MRSDGGVVDIEYAQAPELTTPAPIRPRLRGRPSIVRAGKISSREPWFKSMALRCRLRSSALPSFAQPLPSIQALQTAQLRVSVGTAPPAAARAGAHLFGRDPIPFLTSISNPNAAERARRICGDHTHARAPTSSCSVVTFDGVNLATTLKDDKNLDAIVPANKLSVSGFYNVIVKTPAPGGAIAAHLVHGRKPNGAAFVRHSQHRERRRRANHDHACWRGLRRGLARSRSTARSSHNPPTSTRTR